MVDEGFSFFFPQLAVLDTVGMIDPPAWVTWTALLTCSQLDLVLSMDIILRAVHVTLLPAVQKPDPAS